MPTALLLLGLVTSLVFGADIARAHDPSSEAPSAAESETRHRGDQIESLTQQLLDQNVDPAERQRIAQERRQQLAELMETDPAEVVKRAMPAAARARLAPALRALVEDEVSHDGTLQVLHSDGGPTGSAYLYGLRTVSGEWLSLHFASGAPNVLTGAWVRARGVRVDQALALGEGSLTVLAAPTASGTLGNHRALTIIIKFQDLQSVLTQATSEVQQILFGSSASVSNFWLEASYQQTSLSGDVIGPVVIPLGHSGCNYNLIASLARTAATTLGLLLGSYNHYIYSFSGSGCSWRGLGTVGGSPGEVWVNGSIDSSVVAHELGHNLGLYHSHALDCGAVTFGSGCTSVEYGDQFDTMGSAPTPTHYNAVQKELIGWLGPAGQPPILQVQSSGTYTLEPLETPGTQPKAIKVQTALGDWLYAEFRRPSGFDSNMGGNANVMNGVIVHYWNGDRNGVYVLDMTPGTVTWSDPALTVGSTFTDTAGGVSVSTAWINATTAGVTVTMGSACLRKNASVSVSPVQQAADPGIAANYTVSVTNNDSGCGSSAFTLSVAPPPGWSASLGSGVVTLGSGSTWSGTLQMTSPPTAVAGSYAAPITAAHNGLSTTASAGYVVNDVTGGGGGGGGGGVVGGAPGAFADDFARPDAPDLGNGWSVVAGSLKVVSGEARNELIRTLHLAVQPGLSGADQTVGGTFASMDNNNAPQLGVVLRYRDAGNHYRCYRSVGGVSVVRVSRVASGVEKVLKSVSVPNPIKGALFTVSCQVSGTTFSLKLDGVTKLSTSDATIADGSVGFFAAFGTTGGTTASHRVDNFSASAQ